MYYCIITRQPTTKARTHVVVVAIVVAIVHLVLGRRGGTGAGPLDRFTNAGREVWGGENCGAGRSRAPEGAG